jgi:GrpB-like predicted nucleotidyltransferase (UPF0157 family)
MSLTQPDPILIAGYDPRWPQEYEAERERIVAALGDAMSGVAAIEHVGSTAVPGCAAKPIIDIMIGVQPLVHGERCIAPLEALAYEYKGEQGIPGRFYFSKGEPRSHHIHLIEHGSLFWQKHVRFRDLLRARPDIVEQYSALKRRLAAQFVADRIGYTEAKTPFIEAALAEARLQAKGP